MPTTETPPTEMLTSARRLIEACQRGLGRALSDGEKRDLLKDNTQWDSLDIHRVVQTLSRFDRQALGAIT